MLKIKPLWKISNLSIGFTLVSAFCTEKRRVVKDILSLLTIFKDNLKIFNIKLKTKILKIIEKNQKFKKFKN